MKIYVWDRGGYIWADFALPDGIKPKRVLTIDSQADAGKYLKRETGRIAALLERARAELPDQVKRTLLGRLVSLFRG